MDVCSMRCSHHSCTRHPSFTVEGKKTAAYCKQHAENGMVNLSSKGCRHDSCITKPKFNFEGSKTPACCRKHAEGGMVDIVSRRCSHIACTKHPSWGVASDGVPTTCLRHKNDISGGPVIQFATRCMIVGCRKVSRCGLEGKSPTHCRDHAPLKGGLVCTVGTAQSEKRCRSLSDDAEEGPSFRVKTECRF